MVVKMTELEQVGIGFTLAFCLPVTRLILGIIICYRNFLIFHLLRKKAKRTSTDTLILCNLLSDGLYGLLLFLAIPLNILHVSLLFVSK